MNALSAIIPHRPARPSDFPAAWRDLPPIAGDRLPSAAAAVVDLAARCTGITEVRIKGETRSAPDVKARFICYWLCRERLGWAYARIGNAIGDKDHSTVLNGHRRASRAIDALGLKVGGDLVATVHVLWSASWPAKPGRP